MSTILLRNKFRGVPILMSMEGCYRRSEAWKVVTGEVKHGRLLQEK